MKNTVQYLVRHGLKKFLIPVVVGAVYIVNGCSKQDQLEKNIQEAGGFLPVVEACNGIRNYLLESEYFTDIPVGNCLNKLNPQFVSLIEINGIEFYNIQTSGGFRHTGYLVTTKRTPVAALPFPQWEKKYLGEGVYIYRE